MIHTLRDVQTTDADTLLRYLRAVATKPEWVVEVTPSIAAAILKVSWAKSLCISDIVQFRLRRGGNAISSAMCRRLAEVAQEALECDIIPPVARSILSADISLWLLSLRAWATIRTDITPEKFPTLDGAIYAAVNLLVKMDYKSHGASRHGYSTAVRQGLIRLGWSQASVQASSSLETPQEKPVVVGVTTADLAIRTEFREVWQELAKYGLRLDALEEKEPPREPRRNPFRLLAVPFVSVGRRLQKAGSALIRG